MNSPSNEIAEIQQSMQQVRMSVGVDVHDLVENARAMTDWRRYWRHQPWLWCGAAAVLGYCLVPSRRFGNADARLLAAIAHGSAEKSAPRRANPIISELAGMALGIVIQQGKQLVAQRLAKVFASQTANPVPPYSASGSGQERS